MEQKNNAPKFAFYYLLSLVALIFMSLSTGMIIFQLVNKYIIDLIDQYSGRYEPSALKFAISAIIVSTPIYYYMTSLILKNLHKGYMQKESAIRKWLTYFILLVSAVVVIGWLIGIINTYLEGDLRTKFILKALTALTIASGIFSFYLYEIKRKDVNKKDKIIKIYFYVSILIVLSAFISAFLIVESPKETRNRKLDQNIISNFNQIENAINSYIDDYNKMPENLQILLAEYSYLSEKAIKHPISNQVYEYKIISDIEFELCADFLSVNMEDTNNRYYSEKWKHDVGYQCLKQRVNNLNKIVPIEAR